MSEVGSLPAPHKIFLKKCISEGQFSNTIYFLPIKEIYNLFLQVHSQHCFPAWWGGLKQILVVWVISPLWAAPPPPQTDFLFIFFFLQGGTEWPGPLRQLPPGQERPRDRRWPGGCQGQTLELFTTTLQGNYITFTLQKVPQINLVRKTSRQWDK